MNKEFKFISWHKEAKTDDVIELVNLALKEKDINYKFKREFDIHIDSKKPFRSYKIYKHRGKNNGTWNNSWETF